MNVLGGVATCSEGFVLCFLKVPLAWLGSMAAAVQPDGLWNSPKTFYKTFGTSCRPRLYARCEIETISTGRRTHVVHSGWPIFVTGRERKLISLLISFSDEVEWLAKELRMRLYRTSVKDDLNVGAVFRDLAESYVDKVNSYR